MECRGIRKKLPQFVQGHIPPADAMQVADHVQACAACSAEMAEIEKVWMALGELPVPDAAVNMFPRVLERIDACEQRRAGSGWAWLTFFMPSFAGTAAAIMLIGFVSGALISAMYATDTAQVEPADDSAYSEILSDAPQASFFDLYLQIAGQNDEENSL